MSTEPYTPEEQEFIAAWVSSHSEEGWGGPVDVEGRPLERIAEARRGIAKVKADALREAAGDLIREAGLIPMPNLEHPAVRALWARADRIEGKA